MTRQRAQRDDVGGRRKAAVEECSRHGSFDVDVLPVDHSCEDACYRDVKECADKQRNDDADGQVPLGILGFLGRGGHSVEADVREKYVGGAGSDSSETHGSKRVPIGTPVRAVDVVRAEHDHEEHDGNLDHDNSGIEARALLNAYGQNRGNDQGYEKGRQIETDFHAEQSWGVDEIVRPLEEFGRMSRQDGVRLIEECLCAWQERWVRGLGHLTGHQFLGRCQRRPVVIREPQWHFQVKNIE
jgi:hypothetical protein